MNANGPLSTNLAVHQGARPVETDLQGERCLSPGLELARAAAEGDVQATAKLLRAVGPTVAGVVRAILGSHPDVDDVVQQSLIALVQALPSFRGECEPAGYAGRIAARTAVAARKRSRVQAARTTAVDDEAFPPGSSPTPEGATAGARRMELIRELLGQIPEEQAECLALRVVLGWTLEEVAETTGVPVNTVRSRVRLAKEALRRRIEADPRFAELEESA